VSSWTTKNHTTPVFGNMLCCLLQGDHLSGKPGNVREFEMCQGKNLVGEKCPETVHY